MQARNYLTCKSKDYGTQKIVNAHGPLDILDLSHKKDRYVQ